MPRIRVFFNQIIDQCGCPWTAQSPLQSARSLSGAHLEREEPNFGFLWTPRGHDQRKRSWLAWDIGSSDGLWHHTDSTSALFAVIAIADPSSPPMEPPSAKSVTCSRNRWSSCPRCRMSRPSASPRSGRHEKAANQQQMIGAFDANGPNTLTSLPDQSFWQQAKYPESSSRPQSLGHVNANPTEMTEQ